MILSAPPIISTYSGAESLGDSGLRVVGCNPESEVALDDRRGRFAVASRDAAGRTTFCRPLGYLVDVWIWLMVTPWLARWSTWLFMLA